VIRRSISELCEADHRNDPEILRRWLANKTPEIGGSWIIKPGNSVVSPDARFRGVSRAILTALEARARANGALIEAPFSAPKRLIAFPVCRIYRERRSTREIRHNVELPDVETTHRTNRIGARG
jgi:GNAT superfamily N-acetyltransferase